MGIRIVAATLLLALASGAGAEPVGTTLVPFGASWLYLDDGSDQGSAWRASGFPEVGWGVGPAQLGYGEGQRRAVELAPSCGRAGHGERRLEQAIAGHVPARQK